MVDIKQRTGNYKPPKIKVRTIMKNTKIITLVPDHLKVKMCSHANKNLSFVTRYVCMFVIHIRQ